MKKERKKKAEKRHRMWKKGNKIGIEQYETGRSDDTKWKSQIQNQI